jgi:Cof subfamily protein (haloacid dehalogenase superfamily)
MSKNNISMVITDMDGTLLNDEGVITEGNLSIIKKLEDNDIKFAIATGRGKQPLCNFLDKYNILDKVDYIIGMNGVNFYDMKASESYDLGYLDAYTISKIFNLFKSYNISFVVHENNTVICSRKTIYTDIECKVNNYDVIEINDFTKVINKKYPKLMLIGEKEILDDINKKLSEINNRDFNFFRSHNNFLEIVKKGVSKGNALIELCRTRDIDISSVMAFGDNLNDLDMIRYSGWGIAVENAQEELKLHARFITKGNNEEGFAHACRELLNFDRIS